MADYQGVIAELSQKRDRLANELDQLDSVIRSLKVIAGEAPSSVAARPRSVMATYRGLLLINAVQRALEIHGPLTTKEVVSTLEEGGFESKAQRLYASVYSTMFRLSEGDGPVHKLKDGKWALRAAPSLPLEAAR
jgi:hypothetical protein